MFSSCKTSGSMGKEHSQTCAVNSHADSSSAAYLCLQQESVSVTTQSRLLEAVAKSMKHAAAMSTLLAMELFQARRDLALASSKLLLENSSYELRNAPVNSKTLFGDKIKEVAKANYEAQQQRFLASSSSNTPVQQQKTPYLAPRAFKIPKQPNKPSRPKQTQPYRPKTQTQSLASSTRKDFLKKSRVVTPNSSPPLNLPPQSSESQPFPLPVLPRPDIPVGGRLALFVGQWEKLTDNKWVLSVV